MNAYARFLPWCVVAIALGFLSLKMLPTPEKEGAMRLDDFGKLPVVDGGRVKPIDTVAQDHAHGHERPPGMRDWRG